MASTGTRTTRKRAPKRTVWEKIEQPEGRPYLGEDAKQGILWKMIEHAMPDSEGDPAGMYFYALSAFSVMLGRTNAIMIKNREHPIGISTVLIGDSGDGKKGTCKDDVDVFVNYILQNYPIPEIKKIANISSGEGLVADCRDPDTEQLALSGLISAAVADSVEAKARALMPYHGGRRFFVCDTEFSTTSMPAFDMGTTIGQLRKVFDGDSLSTHTKKEVHYATRPQIVVHGHTTPEAFLRKMNTVHAEGGTYNRMLLCLVHGQQEVSEFEVSESWIREAEKIADTIGANILAAIDEHEEEGTTRLLRLSPEAKELWTTSLYRELRRSDPDQHKLVTHLTTRAAPYCLRIAGLIALVNGSFTVEAWHLRVAAALVRYAKETAAYLVSLLLSGESQLSPTEVKLRNDVKLALTLAGANGLTLSQVSNDVLNARLRVEKRDALLDALGVVRHKIPGQRKNIVMCYLKQHDPMAA